MKRLEVQYAPDDLGGGGTLLGNNGNEGTAGTANNANAGQGNNSDGEGTQSPGWLAGLSKDLRDHPSLQGHQTSSDYVRATIEAHDKLSRAIIKPKEDASPEEVAAYRKEMGIPDSADAYEVEAGEIPESLIKDLKDSYLAAELTPAQAKAVHEKITGMLTDGKSIFEHFDTKMSSRLKADAEKQFQDGMQKLTSEWGDGFQQNLTKARQMSTLVLSKEQIDSLPIEVQNNPVVVEAFYNMSKLVSSDSLLGGSPQRGTKETRMFPNSPGMYKE